MGESVGEILLAPLGESPNFLFSGFEDLQALAPARPPCRHLLGSHSSPHVQPPKNVLPALLDWAYLPRVEPHSSLNPLFHPLPFPGQSPAQGSCL